MLSLSRVNPVVYAVVVFMSVIAGTILQSKVEVKNEMIRRGEMEEQLYLLRTERKRLERILESNNIKIEYKKTEY